MQRRHILKILAVTGMTSMLYADAQAAQLKSLIGSWSGSGVVNFRDNKKEKIRCHAYYTGGTGKLNIAVRCASAGYKIELRTKLKHSGNKLSGTWQERSFNNSGRANGSISDSNIQLKVRSSSVSAAINVSYNKGRQSVRISSQGSNLRSV